MNSTIRRLARPVVAFIALAGALGLLQTAHETAAADPSDPDMETLLLESVTAGSCGSIGNDDMRYLCDGSCGSIGHNDMRYYCQRSCGSIGNDDIRFYPRGTRRSHGADD